MHSCPSCGSTVQEASRFCPICGSSMTHTCPACASPVQHLWHFCPVCSGPLSHQCPSCGALVSVSASFCNACGWPLDAIVPRDPRRVPATVLFASLSVAGHVFDPERVRPTLNEALSECVAIGESWGGQAQRTISDSVRVVFGLDGSSPEDSERAMHASVQMIERIREREAVTGSGDPGLAARIGVEAGDALLPDVPTAEPIVAGAVVHVAAALSEAAHPGSILVGERAARGAGPIWRFGETVQLDGSEETDGAMSARRLLLEGEEFEASDAGDAGVEAAGAGDDGGGSDTAGEAASDPGTLSEARPPADDDGEMDGEHARALEELADDQAGAGRPDEAIQLYLEALSLMRLDPDLAPERARLCVKTLRLATREGGAAAVSDPERIEGLVEEGLAAVGDETTHAWLLALRGACAEFWSGREDDPLPIEERIRAVEGARSISAMLDAPDLRAFVGRTLDALYWSSGEYALAIENARWQLTLVDRASSPAEQAEILVRSAFTILSIEGRYAEVSELAGRAHDLARDAGPHARMHATSLMISAAYYRGRWSELAPILLEHLEAFRAEPGATCPFARGGVALGAVMLAQLGDRQRAADVAALVPFDEGSPGSADGIVARFFVASGDAETGVRISKAVIAASDEPEGAVALIEALASLQRWDDLLDFVPSARVMVDAMALLGPVCDRAEGLAEAAAGRRWQAVEALRGALGAFESLSVPFEAARTREFLAAIALPEEARDLLEHAVATYERLGAIAYAERARNALRTISAPPIRREPPEVQPKAS